MQHLYLATITNFKFSDRHAWSPNCKSAQKMFHIIRVNQIKPNLHKTLHNIKQKSKGGLSIF